MGSFAKYYGNTKIPEDKQELFVKQMRRILDLGGMMDTTEVKMFDQTLVLLQPVGMIKLIYQIADAEENREIGKVIHKSRFSDMKSKNATGNTGRIKIKRLYAVLANRQLRQKYFGF